MSHAGDIDPPAAFEMLTGDPDTVLVDVRSPAEWQFVGIPDLSGLDKQAVGITWRGPQAEATAAFVEQLAASVADRTTPVLFICRSGQRSLAAAQTAASAGWTAAYNVVEGFEGPLDDQRHRGSTGGWKVAGLPWTQS